MGSRYEVEVKIERARDLKNVNWRNGDLRPYVVSWVDPGAKASTKVDVDNGEAPVWDEKLILPVGSIEDAVLAVDVVHADALDDVKPLVGAARIPLREVIEEVGIGGKLTRSVELKRPSGRPQGQLDLKVVVREPKRYYAPPPQQPAAYPNPYGQSRDVYATPYGQAPPPAGYPAYGAPPAGYPPYGAPPAGYPPYGAPPAGYPPYGAPPAGYPAYGGPPAPAYAGQTEMGYGQGEEKKKKFGMGTGLAVGAAAGVLGGLALAEGFDVLEDKIADDAAEKVEDDLW